MKSINKEFLEKVFPLDQVKFAFALRHIYSKNYYLVTL
jgi:hypothetical protein